MSRRKKTENILSFNNLGTEKRSLAEDFNRSAAVTNASIRTQNQATSGRRNESCSPQLQHYFAQRPTCRNRA